MISCQVKGGDKMNKNNTEEMIILASKVKKALDTQKDIKMQEETKIQENTNTQNYLKSQAAEIQRVYDNMKNN